MLCYVVVDHHRKGSRIIWDLWCIIRQKIVHNLLEKKNA